MNAKTFVKGGLSYEFLLTLISVLKRIFDFHSPGLVLIFVFILFMSLFFLCSGECLRIVFPLKSHYFLGFP